MGDRWTIKLKCAYCGLESTVWYAPTCGFYDFKCQEEDEMYPIIDDGGFTKGSIIQLGCGKTNFITASFEVKKAEDVTEDDVVQAFQMASNAPHTVKAIQQDAKDYVKRLKKQIKKRALK